MFNNIVYTVTPGNYSVSQLIIALQALVPMTVTLNKLSNKLTFTSNSSEEITLGGLSQTMDPVFGFEDRSVHTGVSFTADYCCDLSGPSRLQICTNFMLENYDSSAGNSNIFTTIAVDNVPGAYIYYTQVTKDSMKMKNPTLTHIDVDIKDEFGNLINFNNIPVLLCFQIDEVVEVNHSLSFDPHASVVENDSEKN